ncbi:glycoside hydrolase family 38 C-terminal domain-containing protein [Pedobacter sp. JY14-1]|uniref:glycoside hydrolase family 38 C-terminal domain-containing protein n=1 Tax=Pedobacter sp. JY14-1 TaxID=3034151 RepID=UPI0023E21AC9|nr:glycoside hydrolase family 38 C-terminal domain-containing protein [Pedobacter sp. JY14-1]
MNTRRFLLMICFCLQCFQAKSQHNYFIDGYHGGIWGHYPSNYTTFISDMLDKHPFWKINLEIEPVTWDSVRLHDKTGYERLSGYIKDQSVAGRIEFVNPSYGQSYLFNIQGESVIRQFELGILKIRQHFPDALFNTYSSEEPCFTSALPQILKSLGYKNASLKNPNTCWGGYIAAYGNELLYWKGPDGSKLLTVPRYASERLLPGSTWQTIAWNNSKEYLEGARLQGIKNPVGMCIQDAGWKNGPWLGQPKDFEYVTWSQYFTNIADKQNVPEWALTQEDIQVSLVWGAQILQRLAQDTRKAENKLIIAEKLSSINSALLKHKPVKGQFTDAWQNLLLAQHHDSWIVPYNIVDKNRKLNWADQVKIWTGAATRIADSILYKDSMVSELNSAKFKVYNTLAVRRKEAVMLLPERNYNNPVICDYAGKEIQTQQIRTEDGRKGLVFKADVAPLGFASYQIKERSHAAQSNTQRLVFTEGDRYRVSTSVYELIIDARKGGTIASLISRPAGNKELVNKEAGPFNELKGYFYKDSTWFTSAERRAKLSILENGPLRARIKVEGFIGKHPFTQYLTFVQGEPHIDIRARIDWQGSPGIGADYRQHDQWKPEQLQKAFYNDRYKLSALFPLQLNKQNVYKNAAFDVLKSRLNNTFFNSWDSIKNNIIVNWIDVTEVNDERGVALLTDHTTSYSHDENGILGLTIQYSGMGLWGRNYTISGPTEVNYALLPHSGKWDKANIWTESLKWNEPLQLVNGWAGASSGSLLSLSKTGYEVSSIQHNNNELVFRLFNASADDGPVEMIANGLKIKQAVLSELNGRETQTFTLKSGDRNTQRFSLSLPRFGIRTIKLKL